MKSETTTTPSTPEERSLLKDFVGDVFDLERGLPATLIAMFTKPEDVIQSYFEGRNDYVNPFRFMVVILAVTTLVSNFFIDYDHLMKTSMEAGAGKSMDEMIAEWNALVPYDWEAFFTNLQEITKAVSTRFSQLLNILLIAPIMALISFLSFKKRASKFKYHYVMYLYQLTTLSVLSTFLLFFMSFGASLLALTLATFGMMLIHAVYVQGRYLKFRSVGPYIGATVGSMIALFTFQIAFAILTYGGAFLLTEYGG